MTLREVLFVVVVGLCPFAAFGGDAPAKKDEKAPAKKGDTPAKPPQPLHVWAERIHYIQEKSIADITGPATIIKGDTRIDAQHVVAEIDQKTNEFKKMTATGDVHVYTVVPLEKRTVERPPVQLAPDPRTAVCDKATYDSTTGIVVLYGTPQAQPVVNFGKDQVQGDLITFDDNKKIVIVTGRVLLNALLPVKTEETPPPGKGDAPKEAAPK